MIDLGVSFRLDGDAAELAAQAKRRRQAAERDEPSAVREAIRDVSAAAWRAWQSVSGERAEKS